MRNKKCLKSGVFEKWETEIACKPVFWEIERQKCLKSGVFEKWETEIACKPVFWRKANNQDQKCL